MPTYCPRRQRGTAGYIGRRLKRDRVVTPRDQPTNHPRRGKPPFGRLRRDVRRPVGVIFERTACPYPSGGRPPPLKFAISTNPRCTAIVPAWYVPATSEKSVVVICVEFAASLPAGTQASPSQIARASTEAWRRICPAGSGASLTTTRDIPDRVNRRYKRKFIAVRLAHERG